MSFKWNPLVSSHPRTYFYASNEIAAENFSAFALQTERAPIEISIDGEVSFKFALEGGWILDIATMRREVGQEGTKWKVEKYPAKRGAVNVVEHPDWQGILWPGTSENLL